MNGSRPLFAGVTRRQFLKLLGATAGSGAVMNAMTAWGLLESSAQEAPPQLTGSGAGKKVVVLGAGPGGCVAAYELVQLGYDVTVIEAQGHVGGHVITVKNGTRIQEYGKEEQVCDWAEGQWFDAGPSRVPFYHHGFHHYARLFNIPLTDYKIISHNAWLYAESQPATVYSPAIDAGPLSGTPIRVGAMMADMAGYTSELLAKASGQGALDQAVTADDRELLLQYLVSWGMISPEDASYTGSDRRGWDVDPGVNEPGQPSTPYTFEELLPYATSIVSMQSGYLSAIPTYDWQTTLVHPVGGMATFFDDGFVPALGDRVKLNSPVQEIRQDENGVRIVYTDGATGESAEHLADYCICNIPGSVLIKIDADFNSDFRDALQHVAYGMAVRIGLSFKRRFWEIDDQIYGGQSFFNVPEMNILHYPDHGYNDPGGGALLGLYAWDAAAANVSIKSPAERIEFALEYGSRMHPTYREDFVSGMSVAWHLMPYALGAWPDFTPTSREQYYPRLLQPEGRVYLVGEHLSYVNGWMEGAFQSAWYQIEQLHQRASQA